ncbi:hypothetical protein [Listeria booriae]|uniref:Uncharacterized protein n=1 Tax=Listeria booriae TaxID=1552123 RepID=A0A842EZC7_9LIST|nr:hypothetical protein [Listeria booriae]MBC2241848.1 hypothetical protein [Listeria booriae]
MAIFIVNMSNGNLDLHVQVVALNEVEAEQLIKKEHKKIACSPADYLSNIHI